VLRDHHKKEESAGSLLCTCGVARNAPTGRRVADQALKDEMGIGYCNITKCCTEVCPEEIHITDNAIIPLKERVVDEFYDPILRLVRKIRGAPKSE